MSGGEAGSVETFMVVKQVLQIFQSHKKIALSMLAGAALVAGIGYFSFGSQTADPSYRLVALSRGSLTAATVASGTLNPVTIVPVGSQVSGQIRQIFVDYNSPVTKDQVIARIDPDTFESRVAQAEADLEVAKANVLAQRATLLRTVSDLDGTRAGLGAAKAQTSKAEIAMTDSQRDMERKKALAERGFGSMSDRDKTQAAYDQAQAQVRTARAQEVGQNAALKASEAQIKTAEAQVANADAQVKLREAALRQAQVDLERTYIRAPISGVVVQRNVDAGQTVAASLQAPVLFTIAEDLKSMQVEASIDEADVGRIHDGQTVTFTVDAFPGRNFIGGVTQVRKSPVVQQNVVTYTVVISAENPELILFPGMTANVRIVTGQRENVLRVPNAALRFRPSGYSEPATPAASPSTAGSTLGSAGAGGAIRERLIAELNLDPEQQTRLTEIFQKARQRAAERAGEGADRRQQMERIRMESRAEILEILKPEQKTRYEQLVAEPRGGGSAPAQGRVFVADPAGTLRAVPVRLGLSDGTYTEILGDPLPENTTVAIPALQAQKSGTTTPAAGGGIPRIRL